MDDSDPSLLAAVAWALQDTSAFRRADAARAARAASALRGDADAIGGEPARARLAHLMLRLLRNAYGMPPRAVAHFVATASGHLDVPPLDLVRTVEGAERVRRLVEMEPPLDPPDPDRVAAAAGLDDLTAEEAFAAYAAGHIGSPRLMKVTGIRSFNRIIGALQTRNLTLPATPSRVDDVRDDRDLLWEAEAGREDPSLRPEEPPGQRRPTPKPTPALALRWPKRVPADPDSQAALDMLAAELDAEAAAQQRQADRAAAAAAALQDDTAAAGGEEARARLADWTIRLMRSTSGEHRAFFVSTTLLQPLPAQPGSDPELAEGVLEMARTPEGAARFEQWLTPPSATPSDEPPPEAAAVDEAYAAYAEGRIDSRRLMELTGITRFPELLGELHMRGLALPMVPTVTGPGRDDRDLLWES